MICPYEDCDFESSEHGVKTHHTMVHGESIAGLKVECSGCGDTFRKSRTHVERDEKHHCSRKCQRESGRENLTCLYCGDRLEKSYTGKYDSKYCDMECRDNDIWGEDRDGGNHISTTTAGKQWRKAVFQRDEYTCQDCGETGGNLNAHHIKRVEDCEINEDGINEALAIWNGVTVCMDCHAERHSEDYYYQMMKENANEVMG